MIFIPSVALLTIVYLLTSSFKLKENNNSISFYLHSNDCVNCIMHYDLCLNKLDEQKIYPEINIVFTNHNKEQIDLFLCDVIRPKRLPNEIKINNEAFELAKKQLKTKSTSFINITINGKSKVFDIKELEKMEKFIASKK